MVLEVVNRVDFERWGRWAFLEDVWRRRGPCKSRKREKMFPYALNTCRLPVLAWMACMTGNENLPSVRSSANPLFEVYWFILWWDLVGEIWESNPLPCSGGSSNHHEFGNISQSGWRVGHNRCQNEDHESPGIRKLRASRTHRHS